MFYVYQSEYGFTIDTLTNGKAAHADWLFARNAGYFKTAQEAWRHIAASYP
jgi:hypothetical protein